MRLLLSLPLHPEETGYEDIKGSRFLLRVSLSSGTASAHSIRLGMGNQVAGKERGDDVVFIGFSCRDNYFVYVDTIDDRQSCSMVSSGLWVDWRPVQERIRVRWDGGLETQVIFSQLLHY